MNNEVCFILNYAAHYRSLLYQKIDITFKSSFYFGNSVFFPLEKIDYNLLSGFKREIKSKKIIGKFYWHPFAIVLAFKDYDHFILTGDPFCVSNWIVLMILQARKKKSYLWGHGWYGRENWFKRNIKKRYYELADKIFIYGDYAKKIMIEEGFHSEKIVPLYNSLNYDLHLNLRKTCKRTKIFEKYFNNNLPVLIYIGRIQEKKRLDLLVSAVSCLHLSQKGCNVIIIGEDNEGLNLENLVERHNLSKYFWFFGPCYDEEKLSELIYNSNLCVSPGNVGLTAIHSMSYGTPVLTHNDFSNQMPEFEAIIPGLTGDFFEYNDVEDLISKIEKWVFCTSEERNNIRYDCFNVIDNKYNPNIQIKILNENVV